MNQKVFVNILLVVLVVVLAGTVGYFTLVKKSANINAPATSFSLNDREAKYYIAADNIFPEKLYLVYLKNTAVKRVMIVNGEQYHKNVGDQVIVRGKFAEVTYTVYCIQAPCPPLKEIRLEVDDMQVIKAVDNSFFLSNNTYQDDTALFKFPDGFSHNKVCNPQDNHCTVNFEPIYNPYGKIFSFSTFPLKNKDGGSKNINWFWNSEFKIVSSWTIIKNNMQWTVMDVQINYTGLVATYYRIIHGTYLYEFGLIRDKDRTSDVNAVKIIESILSTFDFSGN